MRTRLAVLSSLVVCSLVAERACAADQLVASRLAVIEAGKYVVLSALSTQQPGRAPFVLPTPGSADDPTVHGATLRFSDRGVTGGIADYALDASGWRGLGSPPGSRGYRYLGRNDAGHPNPRSRCRVVTLHARRIWAICRTDDRLTTPFTGALTVELAMPPAARDFATAPSSAARRRGTTRGRCVAATRRRRSPARRATAPKFDRLPSAAVAGRCWYLSFGTSCDDVYSAIGLRYSEATRTFAGSDGSAEGCSAVLMAMGLPRATDLDCTSPEIDIGGLGCFYFDDLGMSYRCTAPPTTSEAEDFGAFRACACHPEDPRDARGGEHGSRRSLAKLSN